MNKPLVSIIKYTEPYGSLREAIGLCEGLKGFNKQDKILIKPNIVAWDFTHPSPFGVITTSVLMFALVQILAEEGFAHIAIGEASGAISKTRGREIYKTLGYDKLKHKYGVELVDFNEEKFVLIDFEEFKLSIAKRALEADKIINFPVLKTHNQCKVSLGIKNLKGCLDYKSKMFCHGVDIELDHTFPRIMEKLPVALTIIDGIFALEKGPVGGMAHRRDIIVASRDTYACDIIGAELIGYRAENVPHLKFYAERYGRSLDIADIDIRGEDVNRQKVFLEYDWEWTGDDTGPKGFEKRGIEGIAVRKYDNTLCTGCSGRFNPMLIMIMAAYKGKPFPNIEVISGKKQLASEGYDKTVLFGKCSCDLNKNNPNIKKAIPINGCPANLEIFTREMKNEGIECDPKQIAN